MDGVGDRAEIAAQIGVAAEGWEGAVRAACRPLVETGAVEARYVERCVELVEEEGPYMVLAPGIALAHARPEDGVRRLCLAVGVLTEPVEFGHPDNDPVDLVFAFGSPDREQHVALLGALARRLEAGLGEELRAAEEAGAARTLLEDTVDDVG